MPTNIGELTLAGALATAVVVLWRKLEEKDRNIMEALRTLEANAEATVLVASALEKLRAALPPRKRESKVPVR